MATPSLLTMDGVATSGVDLLGFVTWTFHISAILFGLIWITVSCYIYYPIIRGIISGYLRAEQTALREGVVWYRIGDIDVDRPEPIVSDGGRQEVPSIDILVPAYDEAAVLPDTIRSLANTEFPLERVTISIIVEPGDTATRQVVNELKTEYTITEIVVPASYPGIANKPRALNYAFEVTSAEIIGVIDAEDLVEPAVLQKVVKHLDEGEGDYAQGLLDMVNEGDGWRNTIFRGEYGFWYRLFLPAAFKSGYPIPLGGSTNFFRRDVLEQVSARRVEVFGHPWTDEQFSWADEHGLNGWIPWDPANVTEDFELGLFLWREGYEARIVRTVTLEESPTSLDGWMRQRTRWHKGKLYTLRQAIAHPPRGAIRKFHLVFHSLLPYYGVLSLVGTIIILLFANVVRYHPPFAIRVLLVIGLVLIPIAIGVQVAGYLLASTVDGRSKYLRAGILMALLPAYWVLTWIAGARASKQLYGGSLVWEKTTHNGNHVPEIDRAQLSGTIRW